MVGSLHAAARAEAEAQLRANPTASMLLDPTWRRILTRAYSALRAHVLLVGYALVAILLGAGVWLNEWYCGRYGAVIEMPTVFLASKGRTEALQELTGLIITTQVGLLGVIAIAVALVTLLGDRSDTRVHTRAYFHQSMVWAIAQSTGALLVVLSAQVLWPLEVVLHAFGVSEHSLFAPIALSIVHVVWGATNVLATTYFVSLSLAYADHATRLMYVQRFLVNIAYPQDIARRIQAERRRQLIGERHATRLGVSLELYPANYFPGVPVVFGPKGRDWVLVDVWSRPFRWAMMSWMRRVSIIPGADPYPGPFIAFPIDINDRVLGRQPICVVGDVTGPNNRERFLLRVSHRFRRVR